MRVSGGDLCTKCRSTDRAGRRDQVLLPLPKRNSHRFGDCFFFVRQNLSEARACRASSPSAAGGRCSEARMAQRSKYGVTPPYFGHRKRGCEATSSPSAPAKKASIFRCFFPLFTPFYGDFTCFFNIDKITAHGLFRTPLFHFHTVFCLLCATQSTQSVGYIIKKASITIQFSL